LSKPLEICNRIHKSSKEYGSIQLNEVINKTNEIERDIKLISKKSEKIATIRISLTAIRLKVEPHSISKIMKLFIRNLYSGPTSAICSSFEAASLT
ncbi:11439_t:CDS:2, partial [Gigaspora margarita]